MSGRGQPSALWTPMVDRLWQKAASARAMKGRRTKPRPFREYQGKPNRFSVEVLGRQPWGLEGLDSPDDEPPINSQARIGWELARHRKVAVRASKGPGKTYYAGGDLIPWFLCSYEDALVITTATSWYQVKNQLWAEVRESYDESPTRLPGTLLTTAWDIGPKWKALALSPRTKEGLAGYHSKASRDGEGSPVLVICDEASGVPDERLDALQGLLTNANSRMLWIGNPSRDQGRFFNLWFPEPGTDPGKSWTKLKISAFDAPPWVVDPEWIEDMKQQCGPDPERHPMYRCDVMAEFPMGGDEVMFPMALLEQHQHGQPGFGGRHMGVDIARGGSDRCVAVLVDNGRVTALHSWSEPGASVDLMRSAEIITHLMSKSTWDVHPADVHIDMDGMGSGVYDRLWQLGHHVDGVSGAEAPENEGYWIDVLGPQRPKFKNRREELHWIAMRLAQEGLLVVPRAKELSGLWADLTRLPKKWEGNRFIVPSKEQLRKPPPTGIGRSPDFSDALIYAVSRTDPTVVRFRRLDGGLPKARAVANRARTRRRTRRR